MTGWQVAGLWLAGISPVAVTVTVWDKWAARRHRRRVPERTLWWLAALGGGVAMWLTMRAIRHKTLHKTFMWGIPVMVAGEALLAAGIWWLISR